MKKIIKQVIFPKRLNLIFLSIFLFGASTSINTTIFPALLSKHNISASGIGTAFSFDILGGILMSFFLHKIVHKIGIIPTLAISSFGYAAATISIYFYQNFPLWILFAFFMGNCFFAFSITRQAWMNIFLESRRRSVALGIFSMTLATGLATGPIIVKFNGAENYSSFLISGAITLMSFCCLAFIRSSSRARVAARRIPLRDFFKKNPLCFLARFFLDLQTYSLLTLTVIFGKKLGLTYEQSGLLITACMASGFFDIWVGFALKKVNPYRMIGIGFVGSVYCFLSILLWHDSYLLLLILYFIFGICIACIYVSAFKITNDDYHRNHLVAANSTFQLIGSSGSICGTLIGGFFLDILGANGLPMLIILSSLLYLTFFIIHEKNPSRS